MTINPNPHPLSWQPAHRGGAMGIENGGRIVCEIDGRHGWMDEALHDGEAFVTFDDGSHETVNWNWLRPEPANTVSTTEGP